MDTKILLGNKIDSVGTLSISTYFLKSADSTVMKMILADFGHSGYFTSEVGDAYPLGLATDVATNLIRKKSNTKWACEFTILVVNYLYSSYNQWRS